MVFLEQSARFIPNAIGLWILKGLLKLHSKASRNGAKWMYSTVEDTARNTHSYHMLNSLVWRGENHSGIITHYWIYTYQCLFTVCRAPHKGCLYQQPYLMFKAALWNRNYKPHLISEQIKTIIFIVFLGRHRKWEHIINISQGSPKMVHSLALPDQVFYSTLCSQHCEAAERASVWDLDPCVFTPCLT